MKTSFFNPEVHSFTFCNFAHVVCGVSWGFQCGGMCCVVLNKFYQGKLIDCESVKQNFANDIWDHQVGIIGSDIYKSCGWGKSMDAIDKISQNIDIGKPTLLYLDLKDWDLVNDHFVVAYAMDDISPTLKQVYIYDPNYVYKRHFCGDPAKGEYCIDPDNPNSKSENFNSYLEINYVDETVTLENGSGPTNVLGFKWYGQDQTGISVGHYTDERNIQHSCNISLISTNPPEIINNKPLISHTVMISKEGNVPADLKLLLEGGMDLYESGNNIFPELLKNDFSASFKHMGLQAGKGYMDKTYQVYQNYTPTNPISIEVQSNFVEERLQLSFPKPAIESFTPFAEGSNPQRQHYYAGSINNKVIKIQGLNKDYVQEIEKIPANFSDNLPVNQVSFSFPGGDWQAAVNNGTYSLFEPVFYLGYIKSNIVIELTHNGLYKDAKVKMTPDGSPSIESQFTDTAVTFTQPGGTQELYNANTEKTLNFQILGEGVSAAFSESFSTTIQYRCLIIHEPLFHQPHIVDLDVFARYFEKLLINIPHSYNIPELERKFNRELEKYPGMDREKFKLIFCEQLISRFVNKSRSFWYYGRVYKNIIKSFHAPDKYRRERTSYIFNKSKNFQELKQNFETLENQMRPLIGKALIAKRPFRNIIAKILSRDWK